MMLALTFSLSCSLMVLTPRHTLKLTTPRLSLFFSSRQNLANFAPPKLLLKDASHARVFENCSEQVYCVAAYDPMFKYILDDSDVRAAF